MGILTLSISATVVVELPDGQRIAGSLESLGRSADNMVKLFVQGCDRRTVAVEEKIEMSLTVEDNLLLPLYWFYPPIGS